MRHLARGCIPECKATHQFAGNEESAAGGEADRVTVFFWSKTMDFLAGLDIEEINGLVVSLKSCANG